MKYFVFNVCIKFSLIFLFTSCNQRYEFPILKGRYLGQQPPGTTPEIFAPGIISTGFDELFGSFTPDGKEFYYILGGKPVWTILVLKEKNGVWAKPEVAPFSPKYRGKFCLSTDGNKIVLTAFRPLNGKGEPSKTCHTWIIERSETGWSEPKLIKILDHAFAPSLAANGNMYFFIDRQGKNDLYVSKFLSGRYTEPVSLGNAVNSTRDEIDPFIAPDERYLMFRSDRTAGAGIYICYKKKDGSWTQAKHMGTEINSFDWVNVGSVTPDGKYIFLFGIKSNYKPYSEEPLSYEEKIEIISGPGNGSIDIYWVDAKIIEELKPEELK